MALPQVAGIIGNREFTKGRILIQCTTAVAHESTPTLNTAYVFITELSPHF